MIGVSLPVDWFLSPEKAPGKIEDILDKLKELGVYSIELRTVRPKHHPEDIQMMAELLWQYGFHITVHGSTTSEETAIEDVFMPLEYMLQDFKQDRLTITIHPIVGDNVRMMTMLSDHVVLNKYPVRFALENNRLLPDKTEGDSTELVYRVVTETERENVGICFDMGHFLYYVKKNKDADIKYMPTKEFFNKVVHTHIHATKGLITHFPLGTYELPLRAYVDKLSRKYYGIYNIELDFPRIAKEWNPVEAIETSVSYMREELPHYAKLYDRTKKEFDKTFYSALSVFEEEGTGTHYSLIRSTSYLFQTNGFCWGMDITFRSAYELAQTPQHAAELLKKLELILITHGHTDHFEERTVRMLSQNDTLWVIPDFLKETALSYGILPEKMILAKDGEEISVGPLSILPFKSNHFRANNGEGVEEYGYYITASDTPSMVFPGDIRDYRLKERSFPKADYCFAHLWLGDDNTDAKACKEQLLPFARYMLGFSDKNLFIGHLYEHGRPDSKMWRMEHAVEAIEVLSELSPETHMIVPDWGQVMKLK